MTTFATPALDSLTNALARLDALLSWAAFGAAGAYGQGATADSFRGLYISESDLERLIDRVPGEPPFQRWAGEPPTLAAREAWPRLREFGDRHELLPIDLDAIVIALAPEVDLRYERLYAYLQDNVTARLPTVELVLNLLCATMEEKVACRWRFSPDAPLVRRGLVRLVEDQSRSETPLLARSLMVDEQIVRVLLGGQALDERLTAFCELTTPAARLQDLPLSSDTRESLLRLVKGREGLRLYFRGRTGSGRRRAAEALAGERGTQLLAVDLARVPATDFARLARLALREGELHDALVYLDGLESIRGDGRTVDLDALGLALGAQPGITILAGTEPWAPPQLPAGSPPLGVLEVAIGAAEAELRSALWQAELERRQIHATPEDVTSLAARFRLTPAQIAEAVAAVEARAASRVRRPGARRRNGSQLTAALFASARAVTGQQLGKLATKVELVYGWDDIVLSEDVIAHLRELPLWVTQREQVMETWGFDRKLSHGKGANALFAGPSGTGKTMAAEIIARDVGLDLYAVDLSGVVSKWIGETEKNLDRVFTAAEDGNAILCFNEADALFGKRSEVSDAHDRYANIEVSYLLQKMDAYEGLAILTTNMLENLDEAFVRRLAVTVRFPFPEAGDRRLIWERVWPPETPLADDVDLDALAQFQLSGGNIKNAALAAAFLAAADGSHVAMRHLRQAVRHEYEKLGMALSTMDLEIEDSGVSGTRVDGS